MNKQHKTGPWEITSEFKTSNNYSIRSMNERLGTYCQGQRTVEPWSNLETKVHISMLKLKAPKFTILPFTEIFPQAQIIHLQMDNIEELSYIAEMGGTHRNVLIDLEKEIWDYLLVNGIMITVEYLPGTHVEADHQSQFVTLSSKQKRICGYRSAVSPIMTQLALFLLGNMHALVV